MKKEEIQAVVRKHPQSLKIMMKKSLLKAGTYKGYIRVSADVVKFNENYYDTIYGVKALVKATLKEEAGEKTKEIWFCHREERMIEKRFLFFKWKTVNPEFCFVHPKKKYLDNGRKDQDYLEVFTVPRKSLMVQWINPNDGTVIDVPGLIIELDKEYRKEHQGEKSGMYVINLDNVLSLEEYSKKGELKWQK